MLAVAYLIHNIGASQPRFGDFLPTKRRKEKEKEKVQRQILSGEGTEMNDGRLALILEMRKN